MNFVNYIPGQSLEKSSWQHHSLLHQLKEFRIIYRRRNIVQFFRVFRETDLQVDFKFIPRKQFLGMNTVKSVKSNVMEVDC